MMWCSYEGLPCLNPLCLAGCVSLKNDRDAELAAAKIIIEALKAKNETRRVRS